MQGGDAVKGLRLTETVSDEKIVISAEATPSSEKIVERKTIVYETRIDPTVIKVTGEKLKAQLFTRFGFMKPKPEEIRLVSINKHYEPYMVISGRYFIDYYRKCTYTIQVDRKVLEIILLNRRFKPDQPIDTYAQDHNVVKLEGEERLMNDVKTSLILDKSGQEVPANSLPSAPSERTPAKILKAHIAKEIPPDADLKVIRSKILKRPKDINRLVKELLEVTERAVIYCPRFRVLYRNLRTGEEKTAEFDGVTSERIHRTRPLTRLLGKMA
jgi:hypothetical protein